jgi:hypothetical protein
MGSTMALAMLLGAAQPAEAPEPQPLPRWLHGCWMAEGEDSRTEECWTAARGSMLLASSHSFAADRTIGFEHMRIERDATGLTFVAQPGGAAPVRFALAEAGTVEGRAFVRFENRAHDYPQVVRYEQMPDDGLLATIMMADGSRAMRWLFRRS